LIEETLLERGIVVSYETIRRWSLKFGVPYARRLRRKWAKRGDIWHLNEILQTRRNTKAARRLLTRPLRKQGAGPERMITDKLKSYGAAKRRGMPLVEHRTSQRPEQQGGELTSAVAKARSLSPPEKSLNRLSIPHPS
jgi:putative transposase